MTDRWKLVCKENKKIFQRSIDRATVPQIKWDVSDFFVVSSDAYREKVLSYYRALDFQPVVNQVCCPLMVAFRWLTDVTHVDRIEGKDLVTSQGA